MMQIQIKRRGIEHDEELNQHVLRHLHFALGRFAPKVRQVDVLLADANGPRGGLDGECRVIVRTGRGEYVVVEELRKDLYAAVARAADRAGRAVSRHMEMGRTSVHTVRAGATLQND